MGKGIPRVAHGALWLWRRLADLSTAVWLWGLLPAGIFSAVTAFIAYALGRDPLLIFLFGVAAFALAMLIYALWKATRALPPATTATAKPAVSTDARDFLFGGIGSPSRLEEIVADMKTDAEIKRIRRLQEARSAGEQPFDVGLWDRLNVLYLYQAACLWVEAPPPANATDPMPMAAVPVLQRLKHGIEDGVLPLFDDEDGKKRAWLLMTPLVIGPVPTPRELRNDLEVDRDGLRAFAQKVGERPKFLFGDAPSDKERRRALIAKGRDVVIRFRTSGEQGFEQFASRDRDYLDIQPHLGDKYQAERSRAADRIIYGPEHDELRIAALLQELTRLQKEWNLD